MHLRRGIQALAFILFPPQCLLCAAPGQTGRDVCAGCENDLPRNLSACQRCARPLKISHSQSLICGACLYKPPAFNHTLAPFLYQFPVEQMLQRLKFKGHLVVARLMADLLGDALAERDAWPQAIIPVPLHPRRLRERGFNQSLEIARPIAQRFGIPLLHQQVYRAHYQRPQTGLNLHERQNNIRRAFKLKRDLQVQRLAIVDDIMTSGSTVNELALALRSAGAQHIEVWVCARTTLD